MERLGIEISRRALLRGLPGLAAVLPASSVAASSSTGRAGTASLPASPAKRVDRLARDLSTALADRSGGKWAVAVRPSGYADEPVAFVDLAEADDRAYSLSAGLVQAICAHCAAYAALGHASRAADAVRLGRKPTAAELDRLDAASEAERAALIVLCRYPARNDPERHEKAGYLLGFAEDDELSGEHVRAILKSMAGLPEEVSHLDRQA